MEWISYKPQQIESEHFCLCLYIVNSIGYTRWAQHDTKFWAIIQCNYKGQRFCLSSLGTTTFRECDDVSKLWKLKTRLHMVSGSEHP